MKIGLFFGSFNPIHIGHCLVARYALEQFKLKQVWFVVSPQNPLKETKLFKDIDYNKINPIYKAPLSPRFQMVQRVCNEMSEDHEFRACGIEYEMELPSYTFKTLQRIKSDKENKKHKFFIIMGSDCFAQLDKWKNYEYILSNFPLLIYPRVGTINVEPKINLSSAQINYFKDLPVLSISSTIIRERIKKAKTIQYMVPNTIYNNQMTYKLYS